MVQIPSTMNEPVLSERRARRWVFAFPGWLAITGFVTLLGAALIFAAIAEDVVTSDWLTLFDVHIVELLHSRLTLPRTRFMLIVSALNGVLAMSVLSVAFAAWLLQHRERVWFLALALAVPGGMLLNAVLKLAFRRARPYFDDPVILLHTFSFPSGHVAGCTLFYGTMAAFLIARTRSLSAHFGVALLALSMIALVAASRMYLGAHYPSDVMAGFFSSIAWLALCLTFVHLVAERRGLSAAHPS